MKKVLRDRSEGAFIGVQPMEDDDWSLGWKNYLGNLRNCC